MPLPGDDPWFAQGNDADKRITLGSGNSLESPLKCRSPMVKIDQPEVSAAKHSQRRLNHMRRTNAPTTPSSKSQMIAEIRARMLARPRRPPLAPEELARTRRALTLLARPASSENPNEPQVSDTPSTDALLRKHRDELGAIPPEDTAAAKSCGGRLLDELLRHTRQLERELNACRVRLAGMEADGLILRCQRRATP